MKVGAWIRTGCVECVFFGVREGENSEQSRASASEPDVYRRLMRVNAETLQRTVRVLFQQHRSRASFEIHSAILSAEKFKTTDL